MVEKTIDHEEKEDDDCWEDEGWAEEVGIKFLNFVISIGNLSTTQ